MTATTFVSVGFGYGHPEISVRTRRHDDHQPGRSPVTVHIEVGELRLMLDDVEAEQLAAAITAALAPLPDAAVP